MRKPIGLGLRAMVCAVALVAGVASPTYAADPTLSDGASASFTGISVVPGGQSAQVDSGIPAGYAQLKASQVASFEAGRNPAKSLAGVKTGSGSKTLLLQATVSPMASTCVGTYPCAAGFTSWLPSLHQMRTIYCVVAFAQTVANWDLATGYKTMGTGSQLGGQDVIYQALGSNTINIDKRALTWINQQFANYGYGFRYVALYPTSTAAFMSLVRADVVLYVETNYVRVNLSYGRYGGFSSGGLHATGTTAYDDNNGLVTSWDPWSLRNTDGTCQSTYYSSSQTSGCVWKMTQANYFLAMDRSGAGTLPVWF